jgi:CheY-like chemotaxis protein
MIVNGIHVRLGSLFVYPFDLELKGNWSNDNWNNVHNSLEESPVARQAVPPTQYTLLQVDDSESNAQLMGAIIAPFNHLKLMTARHGQEGVDMARLHKPDLILMDINMPVIDGYAALRMLQADPATTHIPVIALSSDAFPRQIEKGLAAGFFGYMTKPYKIGELVHEIESTLLLCPR